VAARTACFLGLTCAAALAWLLVTAFQASRDLQPWPAQVQALEAAVRHHDEPAARVSAYRLRRAAESAHARTSGPLWSLAERLPRLGEPVRTTRGITSAVDRLAEGALPAALAAARIDPGVVLQGGHIDLTTLGSLAPALTRADVTVAAADTDLNGLPHVPWLPPLDRARTTLSAKLHLLHEQLHPVALVSELAPGLLGTDGPRRYFLAFQTNAEARGTGGLVGAFGVLVADHGRVTIERLGDNRELAYSPRPVTALGPEFDARYDAFASTRLVENSNITPHFPYAAKIWAAMWERQSGERVDGVIATDPVALSYVLSAIGPVTLTSGQVIRASQVVELTESAAYQRFDGANENRKAYLQQISAAVVQRLLTSAGGSSPAGKIGELAAQLVRAAGERRLLLSSSRPDEEALLEQASVGGAVPDVSQPYAGVILNNAGGNKLDYYLDRAVTYSAGDCGTSSRDSAVVVRLHNAAPAGGHGLSDFVARRVDGRTGRGVDHLLVSLYATRGAQLTAADIDGRPVGVVPQAERGHPVFTADVEVPAQRTVTVTYHLREPAATGDPLVPVQPLVRPMHVVTNVPRCG
jgi:hypothetical protein